MLILLQIVMYGLGAAGLFCAAYWTAAIVKTARTMASVPTAAYGLELARRNPPRAHVRIVVPAHNEADKIGTLVRSLLAQDYPSFDAVFVLDRCTDTTADVIRSIVGTDPRFAVREVRECPAGSAGKVNAMLRGVEAPDGAARPELLLFVDADTALHPSCLSGAVALLEHRGAALLSLLSTLTTDRWFERIVQPVAALELMRRFPLRRVNDPARCRPLANGQFMLFRCADYRAIGGYERVRAEVLEDISIARIMHESGRRISVHLGAGLLTCRMYTTWGAFRRGWKRIYGEAFRLKISRLRRSIFVVTTTMALLPLAGALHLALALLNVASMPAELQRVHEAVACLGLGAWLACMLTIYAIGRVPIWAAPLSPVGAVLVGGILAEAASDLRDGVETEWAGRRYVRTAR